MEAADQPILHPGCGNKPGVPSRLVSWELRGMTPLLVTQMAILPILYWLKPGVWPMALRGVLLYLPAYFLIVRIYFFIWPGFISQWNLEGPWGSILLGLPLGGIRTGRLDSLSGGLPFFHLPVRPRL